MSPVSRVPIKIPNILIEMSSFDCSIENSFLLVFLKSNVLPKTVAFFYDVIVVQKKLSSTVNDVRRKLYTVVIHLVVGKRAKRMPDTTVENTKCNLLHQHNKMSVPSSEISINASDKADHIQYPQRADT